MARFLALIVSVVLVFSCLAAGQKAEVFGGYQYLHMTTGVSGAPAFNLNGWNASVSGFFSKHVGVTADFSGNYGTPNIGGIAIKTRAYTYMFGPVVRLSNPSPLVPFVHGLFGAAHVSGEVLGVSGTSNGFTWAGGGGLDWKAGKILSIRLAQADFVQSHIESATQNHFRYSAGIVLRF